MNKDDITRMAREAGFVGMDGDHGALRRFAALVAAAEREACAKVVDDSQDGITFIGDRHVTVAAAIRARGNSEAA